MSLQRRLVGPPLALAVHPAPITKKEDKKEKEDEKEKKDDGKNNKKDAKEEDKKEPNEDDENKDPVKAKPSPPKDSPLPSPVPAAASPIGQSDSIASPGSMVPEPGTPGQSAPPTPAPANADLPQVPPSQKEKPKSNDDIPVESEQAAPPPEEPLPPLRLIGPVPKRPVKTRLDLDPALPYPPINTDPRGAYNKYAKYMQGEVIYIDITKDGWLSEQWREKPEREALAMLRGENEVRARLEAERARKNAMIRKVPDGAEAIMLDLWNDLVEANNHEISVLDFWAKYDWSDPDTSKHLAPVRRLPVKEEASKEDGNKAEDSAVKENKGKDNKSPGESGDEKASTEDAKDTAKGKTEPEPIVWDDGLDEVEWTKDGLETILRTVGIQCQYNTAKPLGRNWAEPSGAYLILSHDFFMLHTEDLLQWKSEEAANKFEMLVTSGHDRVFGDMVKAQQAEERKKKEKEYRERKLAEKRKAEQAAKEKKKEAGENGDKDPKKDEKEHGGKDEKTDEKRGEKKDDTPDSPKLDVKAEDREQITAQKVEAVAIKGDKAVIAVAVPNETPNDTADEGKPEAEVVAAAPGEATKPEAAEQAKAKVEEEAKEAAPKDKADEGKKPKHSKPFDPVREAELLAKMVAAGKTPPGMDMEDIKLAFKALEVAAGKDRKEKDQQAYIWMWHDSCEKWRWKNFEAGLHNVGPGGWEERDWRVFADDRGCEEFDLEESWAEEDERDVHDWSV